MSYLVIRIKILCLLVCLKSILDKVHKNITFTIMFATFYFEITVHSQNRKFKKKF